MPADLVDADSQIRNTGGPSNDFLRRCAGLHSLAQRAWGRRFLGRGLDRRRASGTEATGYSDYSRGDDFRYVDWNRCARHDELVSKQFRGSHDEAVYVLVDGSGSMASGGGRKALVGRTLAAALSQLALSNLDRVGGAVFSVRIERVLEPVRGLQFGPRMVEFFELEEQHAHAGPWAWHPKDKNSAAAGGTELGRCVREFTERGWPAGLTIVISDLLDKCDPLPAIDLLRRRGYEPYLVHLIDPVDAAPRLAGNFELTGKVELIDAESGQSQRETLDADDVANYRAVFAEFCARVRGYCGHHRLGLLQTSCDVGWEECVRRMIRATAALRVQG